MAFRFIVPTLGLMIILLSTAGIGASDDKPPTDNHVERTEGAKKQIDWRITAYIGIAEIEHVVDQHSLARFANWEVRYAPLESQAALTKVLLDALSQPKDKALPEIPTYVAKEPAEVPPKPTDVEPGPPSHHDLTTLRGRAAFVLERMYNITLPPCVRTDKPEKRHEIQLEAVRQILLSKLKSEFANAARLNKKERLRLAKSTRTPSAVLEALVDDPDTDVLIALANNYGKPPDAHRKLRQRIRTTNMDRDVKETIEEALKRVHSYSPDNPPKFHDLPLRKELRRQAEEKFKGENK